MVGYQEIISILPTPIKWWSMTYPLIGNYGITDEDFETRTPTIGGLIVREYNDLPSNFRYTRTHFPKYWKIMEFQVFPMWIPVN